ncbi:GTPase [Actinomyces trachealis]|uniref:GTPase n=1 Tax=Actinomyces trachealis TaxID=2763540 RepID=UPI0018C84DED|nr:GTPase [Actinomyces trachealis]
MTVTKPLDAAHLEARLERMHAALDLCPGEVPASLAIPARSSLDDVSDRLALGVDHTVAAFFGGTGSGKSSLFNAITQLEFADVGARRPTTSRAAACSWGDDAGALLDFLGVSPERRIRRESLLDASDQEELAGLVLLDVPDYDSVTQDHALQVDRLVPLADVLVWVVDPQKYADAALHEGYLRGLGARQEDMLVLFNQVDTVPEGGERALVDDVRKLLDADGLARVQVLTVSAVRGDNLPAFRKILCERVARESNAARTVSAEMDAISRRLAGCMAKDPVDLDPGLEKPVVEALLRASGAHVVADSVRAALAWPLGKALARPEPPARAAVAAAQTTWLRRTTAGLPQVWLHSIEDAVVSPDQLAAQTAEAVGSVPLPLRNTPLLQLGWWGGLLLAVLGAVLGILAVPQHHPLWIGLLIAAIGVVTMTLTQRARSKRAQHASEQYLRQVRHLVESVVERGLSTPAGRVLARHQILQQAFGL